MVHTEITNKGTIEYDIIPIPSTPIVTHNLKVLPQQVSSQSSLTSTTQVPKGLHIVTIQSFDSIICYLTIS